MESRIGLDYIVENPEYTAKLATGNYYFLIMIRINIVLHKVNLKCWIYIPMITFNNILYIHYIHAKL